ncbi:MAG: protease complex subunit PrcB family protein [Thermoplasmata archaeon]
MDFSLHTVLVSLLGMKPSGGYSIEIIEVIQDTEGAVVEVRASVPGPNCVVTHAITYPGHIVKIPKMEGPF